MREGSPRLMRQAVTTKPCFHPTARRLGRRHAIIACKITHIPWIIRFP